MNAYTNKWKTQKIKTGFYAVLFLFFTTISIQAQTKRQNWLAGDNTFNSVGNFVTKGIANSLAIPPARYHAVSWVDSVGDFWTFGGQASVVGTPQYGNDLWKWNGVNWTWISGESTANQLGVYGTQGVPSSTTTPGARRHPVIWDDNQGNIYLFGGVGPGEEHFNDLWKWNGDQWTWLSGSNTTNQTANYGTIGVTSSSNVPGARYAAAAWTADNGDLFMFGGFGRTASGTGTLQDLWKWDGTNWTWINGSNLHTQSGIYGTIGVANASNVPGARIRSAYWKDENGDFWLYGGQAYVGGTLILATDLWKWDGADWTWVKGSNSASEATNFGTLNVASSTNTPGPRTSAMPWFNPENNKAYLLGGGNYNVHNNDVWEWDGTDWIWVSGSNLAAQASVFTAKGISSSTESIGGIREGNATMDDFGNVYVFGGRHQNSGNVSNSLWRLEEGTFYDGSSWTNGAPSSSSINAYFNASATISASITCNNLYLCNGEYNVRGSATLSGSIIKNGGTMRGSGTLTLNDQSAAANAQIIGDTVTGFTGLLVIPSSATFTTNGKLILDATSFGTGQLLLDGTLIGELGLSIYLNLASGTDNGRYFHLGSPFNDTEVSDFNKGGHFVSGNIDATKNTVWQWDASAADWTSPSLSSLVSSNSPSAFYAGNNSFGNFLKSDSASGKISISGNLNSNPSGDVTTFYSTGQNTSATFIGGTSQAATQGWNMVSNPYPCNYDLDAIQFTSQFSGSKYIWNGSSYEVRNGFGVGNVEFIAPLQAFFVQKNEINGSMAFPESGRATGENVSIQKQSANKKDFLHLSLSLGTATLDQTWLSFAPDAKTGFDHLDAWKLKGSDGLAALYSKSMDHSFAINHLNSDSLVHSVPLYLEYKNHHGDKFKLSIDLNELESYKEIWIEDLKTSNYVNMQNNGNFNFFHDSTMVGPRFIIHLAKAGLGLNQQISQDDFFFHSKEGNLDVVFASHQLSAQISLYNSAGALIAKKNVNGLEAQFNGLKPGIYIVRIENNKGGIVNSKALVN